MESSVYNHSITVHPQDIDELDHVNNVIYLQWIQEAASAHWDDLASPSIKEKFFWVVIRHEIDYHAPAFLHDEIIAKTWVHDYSGPKSTRIVQIFRKSDSRLLAEARTVWCLMNKQTNRPVRVGDDIKNAFAATQH